MIVEPLELDTRLATMVLVRTEHCELQIKAGKFGEDDVLTFLEALNRDLRQYIEQNNAIREGMKS
jgi:hypothetical protein